MSSEDEANIDLARKYRPESLDGYIGNKKMVDTVRHSFEGHKTSEYPTRILLTGTTGCGKTTMARILARTFICSNPQNGKPCEHCPECEVTREYVKTGNCDDITDIIEVNVGKFRGVSDIENLIEEFQYQPDGEFKVYIFDECHMMSETAQNSLLKSLEDLPSYIVLIFCTTDKQKLIAPLVNRCDLSLQVQQPRLQELIKLQAGICKDLDYKWDTSGLRQIAVISGMVIRASLRNLEQVLRNQKCACEEEVNAEFGQVDDKVALDFYQDLLDDNKSAYMVLIYGLQTKGVLVSFVQIVREILQRGILIINGAMPEGLTAQEIKQYGNLFKRFEERDITRILYYLNEIKGGDEFFSLISLIYKLNSPADSMSASDTAADESPEPGEGITDMSLLIDESKTKKIAKEVVEEEKSSKGASMLSDAAEEVSLGSGW